jgi:hypothetical protein
MQPPGRQGFSPRRDHREQEPDRASGPDRQPPAAHVGCDEQGRLVTGDGHLPEGDEPFAIAESVEVGGERDGQEQPTGHRTADRAIPRELTAPAGLAGEVPGRAIDGDLVGRINISL